MNPHNPNKCACNASRHEPSDKHFFQLLQKKPDEDTCEDTQKNEHDDIADYTQMETNAHTALHIHKPIEYLVTKTLKEHINPAHRDSIERVYFSIFGELRATPNSRYIGYIRPITPCEQDMCIVVQLSKSPDIKIIDELRPKVIIYPAFYTIGKAK